MDKGYYEKTVKDGCATYTSQSTIKMDKGYYFTGNLSASLAISPSQSTIKMEKGYYDNITSDMLELV